MIRFTPRLFFQFSGLHSLLIGLLPFFLPILLWKTGTSLGEVSAFIALTGLGFIITLWFWDRLRASNQWRSIIAISFIIEIILVGLLAFDFSMPYLAGLALLNGAYNCFYWSTQRALFSDITTEHNTGKTFGNFQILVVVLLKLGILLGGYLLDTHGIGVILFLTVLISCIGLPLLLKQNKPSDIELGQRLANSTPQAPLSIRDIFRFKDNLQSRTTFLLDGPFLFLESYFWLLSLYLLTEQSFLKLSGVVVILTVILSLVFYVIKNKIDQLNQQHVFIAAVLLYAISWLLRGLLNTAINDWILYPTIIVITFFTVFFRLAFNKRFFDVANTTITYCYLIQKSYYSQLSIVLFFGLFAFALPIHGSIEKQLTITYFLAFPLSILYVVYATKQEDIFVLLKTNKHFKIFTTPFKLLTKYRNSNRPIRYVDKR